jgi:hypothetical protein
MQAIVEQIAGGIVAPTGDLVRAGGEVETLIAPADSVSARICARFKPGREKP